MQLPNTLTDHPSLVGIIRFPCDCIKPTGEIIDIPILCRDDEGQWQTMKQPIMWNKELYGREFTSGSYSVPKTKITDFFPYTYYVLTDGECEPLILHAQYMPSSVCISGNVALSHQPVERYFIEGYKGDTKGHNYNITNLNQMMLPTATNEGIGIMSANANTIMQNRKTQSTGNFLNAVGGVGATIGAMATGNIGLGIGVGMNAISSTINGVNEIKNTDARNKDSQLTPNSISSFGTPSTRDKFDNNKVRLLKYTIKDNVKNKIEGYVNRYGNKYNNYDTINLKSYKGYIKFIGVDLDSKIDNNDLTKIKQILERGVYCE